MYTTISFCNDPKIIGDIGWCWDIWYECSAVYSMMNDAGGLCCNSCARFLSKTLLNFEAHLKEESKSLNFGKIEQYKTIIKVRACIDDSWGKNENVFVLDDDIVGVCAAKIKKYYVMCHDELFFRESQLTSHSLSFHFISQKQILLSSIEGLRWRHITGEMWSFC